MSTRRTRGLAWLSARTTKRPHSTATRLSTMSHAGRPPTPHLLLNFAGWLLFGAAMTIGWIEVMPWHVQLATTPVYIVLGFLVSLLLGRAYDRLGVGQSTFGRTLAIIVAGSFA